MTSKQEFLYHASPDKNLTIIQPQRTLSHNIYIGDFVFATSDKQLAAMYLATRGNATLMKIDTDKPRIVICSDPSDYLANDTGGAIYKVPSKTFRKTPQEGLEDSELVSKVAVKPLNKKVYEHSIDAMREMGIEIYFVNKEVFTKIQQAKDESSVISSLSPFLEIKK